MDARLSACKRASLLQFILGCEHSLLALCGLRSARPPPAFLCPSAFAVLPHVPQPPAPPTLPAVLLRLGPLHPCMAVVHSGKHTLDSLLASVPFAACSMPLAMRCWTSLWAWRRGASCASSRSF